MSDRRALVVPADAGQPCRVLPLSDDDHARFLAIKAAVGGGYLEAIRLTDTLLMYMDEYGKDNGLPYNPRATALGWAAGIRPDDRIVGDAVIVGDDGTPMTVGINPVNISTLIDIGLWPVDKETEQ